MKKLNPRTIALTLGVLLVIATGLGAQYATKVYIEQGGAKQVVASGGEVEVQSGGTLDVQSGATLNLLGSSFDPASYVLKTAAAQVSIAATGAGNDITLTAADDLIFAAGAAGDVLFTPGVGRNFTVNGGAAAANGYDVAWGDNDLLFTAYDATRTSSLELNSAGFDVMPAASTYFNVDVGGGIDELAVSQTAVAVSPATSFAVDINGGTDELGISENVVSVSTGILFRIVPTAAPPAACAAGTEGGLYLDLDTHLLCVCNATAWVQVADGTTGCS